VHQWRFDGDAPIFVFLPPNLNDGPICCEPDVTDVGPDKLIGSQTGQKACQDKCPIPFDPVAATPLRLGV
jgi:hypothetical protein